jgi:hypothetical protein
MKSTIAFVDGVWVIQLMSGGWDAANDRRVDGERAHLEKKLKEIPRTTAILVDLSSLPSLGAAEVADFTAIAAHVFYDWKLPLLIVVSNRLEFQTMLRRFHGQKLQFFPTMKEARTALSNLEATG